MKSIFEREEFKPLEAAWKNRLDKLQRRHDYYSGAVYERHKYRFGWWFGQRLYRGIRPLFLPFARAVEVDCGLIPGKWSFPDEAPEPWIEGRKQLWSWSEWATKGVLYVHYGSIFGVSGLKVADLRDRGQVIVAPVDPRRFMLVTNGAYDPTPAMSIYIEMRRGAEGEYEYAEVITPQTITTYKAGEPFGFEGREASYTNELGFVPYVEVPHIETGEALGECTFQKAMRILDELNNLSSYLADIVEKHAEPQYVASGVQKGDLKKGDNIWFAPEGSKIEAILADIDIDGVRGFIQQISDNVDRALPETAFDELRSKDQIATATLELQLQELVFKVKRTRPNYDAGLVRALRLAGQAAKQMGIGEVAVLDDDNLMLDDERPVLRANLDTRELADYLLKSGAPSEAVWKLLEIDQDTIDEWNRLKAEKQAQFNNMLDSDGETAL